MALRLVSSRPVGVRAEHRGSLSSIHPKLISRRTALSQLAKVGLVGVAAPNIVMVSAGCTQADYEEVARLILAAIVNYAVDKLSYAVQESIGGPIELENQSNEDVSGSVEMNLVSSQRIVDRGSDDYTVPAGFVNTYVWSGLASGESGSFKAVAKSALGTAESGTFTIG